MQHNNNVLNGKNDGMYGEHIKYYSLLLTIKFILSFCS